ncbi:tRNA (adenosine(37)-N6)-threonylcarbamoyltransferase complex ATPase subunit type 1 TsaE [Metamycoplasma phocicerebrale]|uniref:tRNA threonylcarbamoyladenosine biosynthesis protein TsaE n=1 Tax=Metamycoplasma phocicerebrale TaxID=142649 RepID=A0A3T0TUR2_9BACT|nr:tRNA (adenosine(37)-N6)-threonylcarbamoyltransferase complex ATPase subunit type 1 TsaE [Metamycoplasma phocicerebrale]AZZ65783.1 tRNA (adenosine(37)-N6)-threonylcarbamoyltransferase complex ATPase subunit type 1 TsaE [Metamycoplasma phocicerebrale]
MFKKFYFKENQSLKSLVDYILSFKNVEAILLNGELGAGKTTLTSQIAKTLGENKTIISPTFNTILIYDKIVHIDAYKLKGDLFAYEEYFDNKLVIIEWSDNITHNFKKYLKIKVSLETIKEEVYHVFSIVEQTCKKSLFIETSLEDFFVAILEDDRVIDYVIKKDLIKKTDYFFNVLDDILNRNNLDINNIDEIYTTTGPGSFTGARLGFSYARTNAQVQPKVANNFIKLKLSPTYELFFIQKQENTVYIKANKYKSYKINKLKNKIEIEIIDASEEFLDKFNYNDFIENPKKYLKAFKESNNLLSEELVYASEPQIGGQ